MASANNPQGPQGRAALQEEPRRSVRESAIALLASWDRKAVSITDVGQISAELIRSVEDLRAALAEPEFSRAQLLPDAPWAVEGIEFMKAGKPILPKHIHSIVHAAEAGLQAAGSFERRWAADMRAIARWQKGDPLPTDTRSLLAEAAREIESAMSEYADHPNGMGAAYRDASKVKAAIDDHLAEAAPGGRDLIWPDHADLVVWLLELLDRRPDDPLVDDVHRLADRVGRAGLWHASQGSAHGDSIDGSEVANVLRNLAKALIAADRRAFIAEERVRLVEQAISDAASAEGLAPGGHYPAGQCRPGPDYPAPGEVEAMRGALEKLVEVADAVADVENTSVMDEAITQARAALSPPQPQQEGPSRESYKLAWEMLSKPLTWVHTAGKALPVRYLGLNLAEVANELIRAKYPDLAPLIPALGADPSIDEMRRRQPVPGEHEGQGQP